MESKIISDNDILFKFVLEGDINEIKFLINDSKVSVNCSDEQGMTPLHHAAFKGKLEVCKLLLDCGADVNANQHVYGYSALCLAAISNHCDVVLLLLEHGADINTVNSNNRTASQMAAFVGSHRAVCIINNYISREVIDYFTEIHGLNKEPKLPAILSGPVHKLVIMPNIHPVRIALYLLSNSIILQNMKRVIDVLNILAEKQLKEESNDRMSLKSHHIAFVLSFILDHIASQKKKVGDDEATSDHKKLLDMLIKAWLKGCNDSDISLTLEKFLRKSISAYPFQDCLLYQHVVTTISVTEVGNEPNALILLSNAIVGPHSYSEDGGCATCGDQNASSKTCSVCKSVQYCDKTCQKLHWFVHKNVCKKAEISE